MSIRKLLIANRAEIAIRIARAAAELGIRTLAIAPADDRGSAHLRYADEVAPLEGVGTAAYLDARQIVEIARASGCDAVHPGYGFLSENAGFARTCAGAGLTFVGPGPDLIELFGDKGKARALAVSCEVPVPRGREGPVTLKEASAFLRALGPGSAIMIKALAGGGGRGIRIVRDEAEVGAAFERCRSEARLSFGHDGLYVEELVAQARHIEIQVVGDGHGAVRHLWERECSLQRRHQKVVEVAPSPSLPRDLRDAIADAALRMATRVGYTSLGTFEFLVRREPGRGESAFVFIEGNPRLQVEHTITEAVTGVDLVKAQLRVAGGASLAEAGLGADAVAPPRGYAVQLRLTMERIAADGSATPASGEITRFDLPTGPGVRTDTFGAIGYRTSTMFDALLAKIIVHADAPFPVTVDKAGRALAETRIEGVDTNHTLLAALLADPRVRDNDVDTTFLERHVADFAARAAQRPETASPMAAAGGTAPGLSRRAAPRPGTECILSPLQGRVAALDVAVGERVRSGEVVAVIEAMKMETPVVSPASGIVEEHATEVGSLVGLDDPLVLVRVSQDPEEAAADDAADIDPDHLRPDLAGVLGRHRALLDEARPEPVARRRARGGRTARENIADLCDPDSFLEYGALALPVQRDRFSRAELIERGPADGLITGIATVNGTLFGDAGRCMVMAYDYTAFAGTQGILAHQKKDRLLEVAERFELPLVVFAEGGGGRPGDGDAMRMTGIASKTFWRFARLNGRVPLVAIVSGRCFAGNAALAGCCDVIIATRDTTIGMAGPAMIEGGGLGVVRPEEVGPISVQAPNGVVDLVVADEADAVRQAKRYLAFFQGSTATFACADQRLLRQAVPDNRRRVYDVRVVIDTLADRDSVLELRRAFAPGLLTCLARIEGRPIGIIANDPAHLGGAIDSDGADKAARFVRLCDAFGLPVLSLCDTPGFMVGPEAEKTGAVRHMSRLFLATAGLTVPFIAIVLRKGYGLGAMAMLGGCTGASALTVAWPTGEFGGMGPEGAVELAYRRELAAVEGAARKELFDTLVGEIYARGQALEVASNFEIDGVIDPAATRGSIVRVLRAAGASAARERARPVLDSW